MKNKKLWQLTAGLIISALFIWLAVRKVDFSSFVSGLKQANFWYLIPAIMIFALAYFIRCIRWQFLLKPIRKIKYWRLFPVMMIGWFANSVLPARLGEFVRAYALGRKEKISKSLSFATIVVERVFDGLALLTFLIIGMLFFPFPDWVTRTMYIIAAIFVGGLIILFLLVYQKKLAKRFLAFIGRIFPAKITKRIDQVFESFVTGLKSLQKPSLFIIVYIYSLIIWAIEAFVYYFVIIAFGQHLPWYAPVIVMIILNIGIMIPSSPGYVGTYEYFAVLGLALFGVGKGLGLSIAVVLHILMLLYIILIGGICLIKENISLTLVEKEKNAK